MLPKTVQNLINQLAQLPGIGPKTAQRLALYLLNWPESRLKMLGQAFTELKKDLKLCSQCFFFAEEDLCVFCRDPKRDHLMICVVSSPLDVVAIERVGVYKGLYHILGGRISLLEGVGPSDLRIKELVERVKKNKKIKEVILATNPDLEGETTALYLAKVLKPLGVKVTRLARGLPTGAELEYADEITLSKALEGRQNY